MLQPHVVEIHSITILFNRLKLFFFAIFASFLRTKKAKFIKDFLECFMRWSESETPLVLTVPRTLSMVVLFRDTRVAKHLLTVLAFKGIINQIFADSAGETVQEICILCLSLCSQNLHENKIFNLQFGFIYFRIWYRSHYIGRHGRLLPTMGGPLHPTNKWVSSLRSLVVCVRLFLLHFSHKLSNK